MFIKSLSVIDFSFIFDTTLTSTNTSSHFLTLQNISSLYLPYYSLPYTPHFTIFDSHHIVLWTIVHFHNLSTFGTHLVTTLEHSSCIWCTYWSLLETLHSCCSVHITNFNYPFLIIYTLLTSNHSPSAADPTLLAFKLPTLYMVVISKLAPSLRWIGLNKTSPTLYLSSTYY